MQTTQETTQIPASALVKRQVKTYGPKSYSEHGHIFRITVGVRHDDECGNGHNSFAITATIDEKLGNGRWVDHMGGCCHEEVAKHFPELAPLIKWHLTSTDEPMHYIANTLYWLGYSGWCDGKAGSPPNLKHARSTAVWPDMPESFLASTITQEGALRGSLSEQGAMVKEALESRLAGLLCDFKQAVESLGFTY